MDAHATAVALVTRALEEDLAQGVDVTSVATVPDDATGSATLVARADGVVAGLDLVAEVYRQVDERVTVERVAADGDRVTRGDAVARVDGPLRAILTGERTALNLVTHLSGVATATRAHVDAVAGTDCVVRDTRKTTPGMRQLEKAAVRAGGGVNHRVGLFDGLLVKDNHVVAAGSVGAATRAALDAAGGLPVQVEVDDLDQLREAIDAGARDVLLDNFTPDLVRQAVTIVRALESGHGRILLEASGTLRLDTVREYAEAGVDRVSVGAITHSAPQLDLALDIQPT
ncbi:MAG: carboxylating nicotinate-nucleotide diphosphorylase, partial [Nitriliruptoraceae bacterium]